MITHIISNYYFTIKGLAFLICFQLFSCANNDDEYIALTPEEREQYSGGETTVFNTSEEAFVFFAPNLTLDEQSDFGIGNSFFRQSWVSAQPLLQLQEMVWGHFLMQ